MRKKREKQPIPPREWFWTEELSIELYEATMDRLPAVLDTVLILKDEDGVPKHFRGHASEWPIVLAALEDAKQALAREAEGRLRIVGGTDARAPAPEPAEPGDLTRSRSLPKRERTVARRPKRLISRQEADG